ncbi:DUF3592 domain-containing protein [Hahella ganghwensis]|uniref:DUF3592 domain-containing protein n=1 Tax=Hahella ganghwensis TaxID=286420 RepID=UPI000361AD2E|nr:DUF3592 domain-containing protein [Hahella ganghwensis]
MDVLILLMGLTLISAGWVLLWEFTRFLHCAYAVQGRVVSLEPDYSRSTRHTGERRSSYYFFPIIEYFWEGDKIRFTSLDESCISGLQVGDQVQLSFSRSRRKHTRIGRFATIMICMMAMLIAGVVSGAALLSQSVDLYHVLFASIILAICLFIIVLYMRQQDETAVDSDKHARRSVLNCVFLQEPTNVCYWKNLFTNRRQRRRIVISKMFGGGCLASGLLLFVMALYDGYTSYTDPSLEGYAAEAAYSAQGDVSSQVLMSN